MRFSLKTLFLLTLLIGAGLAISIQVSQTLFAFLLPLIAVVAVNFGIVAALMALLGAVERFIRDSRR